MNTSVSRSSLARRVSSLWDDSELESERVRLQAEGRRFIDTEFPEKLGVGRKHKVVWMRLHEIFPNVDCRKLLFGSGVDGSLVRQGQLGDCFFVAALALLSNHEDKIRHLFVTDTYNSEGLYCLQFFKHGQWKRVVIDDRLPCKRIKRKGVVSYKLVLARCTSGDTVWASLVEKAYAKCYGSYAYICGGNVSEALVDLTGAPVQDVSLERRESRKNAFFKHLHESVEKNALVGCAMCVKADTSGRIRHSKGVQHNHAYSVRKTSIIKRESGPPRRMILVRNPQVTSCTEYKGEYRKGVGLWTEELKEKLGYDHLQKGEFWMSWAEFYTLFNRVYICRIDASPLEMFSFWDAWDEDTSGGCTEFSSWRSNPCYEVNVEQESTISICLQQNDWKIQRKRDTRDALSNISDINNESLQCNLKIKAEASEDDSADNANYSESSDGDDAVSPELSGGILNEVADQNNDNAGMTMYKYEMIGITVVKFPTPADSPFIDHSKSSTVARSSLWNKRDVSLDFQAKPGLSYLVLPSTYERGRQGDFCLNFYSPQHGKISIRKRESCLGSLQVAGSWTNTMSGGPPKGTSFGSNPKFKLYSENTMDPTRQISVFLALRQRERKRERRAGIGICILKKAEYAIDALAGATTMGMDKSWFIGNTIYSNSEEVHRLIQVQAKSLPLLVVPCTYEAGHKGTFDICMYWRNDGDVRLLLDDIDTDTNEYRC